MNATSKVVIATFRKRDTLKVINSISTVYLILRYVACIVVSRPYSIETFVRLSTTRSESRAGDQSGT